VPRFTGDADFQHGAQTRIGVLLMNLGTPDAPTAGALRLYLRQFLSDPRVIEAPRWWWLPLLYGVIAPMRAPKSAAKYREVWTKDGSPLLAISKQQCRLLQERFDADENAPVTVALGMRYGKPSIASALDELLAQECRYVAALPLYPQYSAASAGTAFDALADALRGRRRIPHLHFAADYCAHPAYIAAVAQSVAEYRQEHGGADKLVFSFHGMPLATLSAGDPYHCQCQKTARLVAGKLGLKNDEWLCVFQSRFGAAPWLRPYLDETMAKLAKAGMASVQVISPGFAADCLETLEEIALENRDIFLQAGGKQFAYIPALNAQNAHIDMLHKIAAASIANWRDDVSAANNPAALQEQKTRAAALKESGYY
jgi:ferrochelatase